LVIQFCDTGEASTRWHFGNISSYLLLSPSPSTPLPFPHQTPSSMWRVGSLSFRWTLYFYPLLLFYFWRVLEGRDQVLNDFFQNMSARQYVTSKKQKTLISLSRKHMKVQNILQTLSKLKALFSVITHIFQNINWNWS